MLFAARTRCHGARAERAVVGLSRLGEHGAVWLALGALAQGVDASRRAQWRRATAAVACAYGLNTALKLLVRRRRPRPEGLPALSGTPTPLSFPSAHASTSFAGALGYSRLGLPRVPMYALALGLSASRVYLGVHYPSDVLAGALLGSAVGHRLAANGAPRPLGGRGAR